MIMSRLIFHTISLFWPARCPLCGEISQQRDSLCMKCCGEVKRVSNACKGCGCPGSSCTCAKSGFKLNLAAPFEYSGVLRKAVHRFKFSCEKNLAAFFACEMLKALSAEFQVPAFDIVVCVPQTRRRRRERGYNQSALLAKSCARLLKVPTDVSVLEKQRDTADQHSLKSNERLKNVKNAFALSKDKDVSGKTVLLCDDVKTTGATLNECRKVLLKAGAKEVFCVTIAVTVRE